jgi:hypothetical protein
LIALAREHSGHDNIPVGIVKLSLAKAINKSEIASSGEKH